MADATDGGENTPAPANTPAPPPAAAAVVNSGAKETDASELLAERQKREELERKLKEREVECAHLQDENHRLKTPPAAPAPAPTPKKERAPGWLDAYRSPDELDGAD